MWKVKPKLFCLSFLIFLFFGSCLCYSCTQEDEPFSRRIAVQEHIDECLCIVYKMKNGDIEQQQGLEHLEDMLELLKFITWYWVED